MGSAFFFDSHLHSIFKYHTRAIISCPRFEAANFEF